MMRSHLTELSLFEQVDAQHHRRSAFLAFQNLMYSDSNAATVNSDLVDHYLKMAFAIVAFALRLIQRRPLESVVRRHVARTEAPSHLTASNCRSRQPYPPWKSPAEL